MVLLISCSKMSDPEETSFKRYPFKSAHIKYEISGAGHGSEELYIYNFGEYELVVSDYVGALDGQPRPIKQSVITRAANVYVFSPGASVGRHILIRSLDSLYHLKNNFPSYTEALDGVLEQGKFQFEGSEVISGITAQCWRQVLGNTTLFFYNGLVLKRIIDGQSGNSMIQTAITVDTAWTADTSLFVLPSGITFQTDLQPSSAQ
jgi:hypothetical protein